MKNIEMIQKFNNSFENDSLFQIIGQENTPDMILNND
jgi:hypothetical protein